MVSMDLNHHVRIFESCRRFEQQETTSMNITWFALSYPTSISTIGPIKREPNVFLSSHKATFINLLCVGGALLLKPYKILHLFFKTQIRHNSKRLQLFTSLYTIVHNKLSVYQWIQNFLMYLSSRQLHARTKLLPYPNRLTLLPQKHNHNIVIYYILTRLSIIDHLRRYQVLMHEKQNRASNRNFGIWILTRIINREKGMTINHIKILSSKKETVLLNYLFNRSLTSTKT